LPKLISLISTSCSSSVLKLLDCTDPDLHDWTAVGIAPPEEYDHDVMRLLRSFALMKQKN
jgi:succinate dehydrogenase flavin-adding protein (antitoxin of CptAB toxin-antitoxin module)